MDTNAKLKMVYTVVEGKEGKSFWTKVGIGTVNKDGSLNLHLEALPVNGTLQVRDYEPREDRKWETNGASHAAADHGTSPRAHT